MFNWIHTTSFHEFKIPRQENRVGKLERVEGCHLFTKQVVAFHPPFRPTPTFPPFTATLYKPYLVMEASLLQSISLEAFLFSRGPKKTRKSKIWQQRRRRLRRRRHCDYTEAVFLCISRVRIYRERANAPSPSPPPPQLLLPPPRRRRRARGTEIDSRRGVPRRWRQYGSFKAKLLL